MLTLGKKWMHKQWRRSLKKKVFRLVRGIQESPSFIQSVDENTCARLAELFFFNATVEELLSLLKCQVEKKLKLQVASVEQQNLKSQEVLREKEQNLGKLEAQLKTATGSYEEEMKKLKGQIVELEKLRVKKVSMKQKCWITLLVYVREPSI